MVVEEPMSNSTLILNLVQSVGVICALLFTAYQIHLHTRERRFQNYLGASLRGLDLAKMLVENKSLRVLYEYSSDKLEKKYEDLTDDEKALVYYCDLIIFLCETVWVAHYERWVDADEWSYWKKWTDDLMHSRYFRWTVNWVRDDYEPEFIAALEARGTASRES